MGQSILMTISDNFSFRVIIDIIVVAFVLYKLLSLFQKTSAMSIIKGIAVVVVVNIVANLFNLDALKWMITQATTIALVAIPVVFQPELRHALERIGRGEIFAGNRGLGDSDKTIDFVKTLMRATYYMASKNIGALIIIERETGTDNLASVGIELDANASYELLVNIFTPNTPLHDGAIIIRDNKIRAASCVLPLSTKPYKARKIGTRHRAALGVTEESDAIAIVVSEELGIVSVVENGEFWPEHDEQLVTAKLIDRLVLKKAYVWSKKRGEGK